MGTEQAAQLGHLLSHAAFQQSGETLGEHWIRMACENSPGVVRRAVTRRIEELAAALEHKTPPDALVTLMVDVPMETIEDFRRARILASRKAGRVLTEGQTVSHVLEDYRTRHDPLLQQAGVRRVGPTALRLHDRYIPVEVRLEIVRRSHDSCERCRGTGFLTFAHLTPHRLGSAREAKDFIRLCPLCHTMYDGGYVWLEPTSGHGSGIEAWPTRARFRDAWGNVALPLAHLPEEEPPPDGGGPNGPAEGSQGGEDCAGEVRERGLSWNGARLEAAHGALRASCAVPWAGRRDSRRRDSRREDRPGPET